MKTKKTACLFKGRHPIPENPDPVYIDWDFKSNSPKVFFPPPIIEGHPDCLDSKRQSLEVELLKCLEEGGEVRLYVTGLTPALTYFLSRAIFSASEGKGNLCLLHYNSETGSYWEQWVVGYADVWTCAYDGVEHGQPNVFRIREAREKDYVGFPHSKFWEGEFASESEAEKKLHHLVVLAGDMEE